MQNEPGPLINQTGQVRTWSLTVPITGPLESQEMADWPSHIQDGILEAMERLAARVQLPLSIVSANWDIDWGERSDGKDDSCFISVIVSEIVVKDTGFGHRKDDALKMMERMFNEQMKRPN